MGTTTKQWNNLCDGKCHLCEDETIERCANMRSYRWGSRVLLAMHIIQNGTPFSQVEEGGDPECGPHVFGLHGFRMGSVMVIFPVDSWGLRYEDRAYMLSRKALRGWKDNGDPVNYYPVNSGEWEYDFPHKTASFLSAYQRHLNR
jgi:hypothetical protein